MQKTNEKRAKKLEQHVKKHGWLDVMILTKIEDATTCKQWLKRRKIPEWHWAKIEKLIKGEVQVEISII